ncbi:hypothetical protein BC936DRAFT_148997 [Jimgerdemannia flammicorona]|uniref:UBA domain-containing protein n=1 Tax=Jimgerdemannia flammicorona TaxID=994334 RepID=A0A433D1T1_9FUNG|nr:hypothetical protein BC936DRAFT_148997 [Jimgerdemannia flammicorona]
MSASAIKVVYNSVARRIAVQPTTEWSELSQTFASLFGLPPSSSSAITLSYTDSDGDTITLDTTLEIHDTIAQGITKFRLNDGAGDWILEGAETPKTVESSRVFEPVVVEVKPVESSRAFEPVVVEELKASEESIPEPVEIVAPKPRVGRNYATTIETEEEEEEEEEESRPAYPSSRQEKGKWRAESPAESSRSASTASQPSATATATPRQSDEEVPPFVLVAQQLEKLCDQFRDVLNHNPQIVEAANDLMDQVTRNIPVDIDRFAAWLNARRDQDAQANNINPFSQPFPFAEFQHPLFQDGGFAPAHPLWGAQRPANPWEQKQQQRPANPWEQKQHQRSVDGDFGSKIAQLNAMGFVETYSNESFERLLKRYEGNVDRVVEVLIQRQTDATA